MEVLQEIISLRCEPVVDFRRIAQLAQRGVLLLKRDEIVHNVARVLDRTSLKDVHKVEREIALHEKFFGKLPFRGI